MGMDYLSKIGRKILAVKIISGGHLLRRCVKCWKSCPAKHKPSLFCTAAIIMETQVVQILLLCIVSTCWGQQGNPVLIDRLEVL